MKIIGITGKSGAGKTTISSILESYGNVKAIHVDELMDNIKVRKFSKIMDKDNEENPIVVKKKLRQIVYSSKFTFMVFMKIKSAMLQEELANEIEQARKEGKEAVLIDSIYLNYLKLYAVDFEILMRREYVNRLSSVLQRDEAKGVTKEVFVIRDIPYKRSYVKEDLSRYKYVIENNTTIEHLQEKAREIYDKDIHELTMVEKYKVQLEHSQKKDRERTSENSKKSQIGVR